MDRGRQQRRRRADGRNVEVRWSVEVSMGRCFREAASAVVAQAAALVAATVGAGNEEEQNMGRGQAARVARARRE